MKGNKLKLADIHTLIDQITDEFPLKNIFSEKVFQAAIDPSSFYKEHKSFFNQFEINEPFPKLYKWVLHHELENAKRAYTIECTADLTDINLAVSALSGHKITSILFPLDSHKKTEKMLKKASAKLKLTGLSLLSLDSDAEFYTLILVPVERVKFIKLLAEKCKLKLEKI